MEEMLTRKLTGAIFGFKQGTKTAKEVQDLLDKLKRVNSLLADDYEKKYVAAARERSVKMAA
jgi:hypothetical protein